MSIEILTPVGRFVTGSLYKPNTTDAEGKPLVIKTGANAGQPRVEYLVGIAIPKQGEQHWNQTAWGQKIWQTGVAAFPAVSQAPTFAWKVKDGDSQIPNRRGRKPCENEGWAGCWVLFFSGGYAPKIKDAQGRNDITEVDAVKPGYYIQVFGSVAGNGSQQQAGVYLNHAAVALSGYGPEIQQTRDFSEVGFGASPLPVGATTTPVAAMQAPAPVAPPVAAAPVAVAPNPAFLQVPGAPVPPAAPPAGPVMTAKAGGATYQQFLSAGWTHQQMVEQGMVLA